MSPHGHHHGGGGGGHHHHHHGGGVHHFQHHPPGRQHYRHVGPGGGGTNVVFMGGAPGYYTNSYYGGYGGYFGPTRRSTVTVGQPWQIDCICVRNQSAMRLYWVSILVSFIVGVVLLSTISQSCPSGCHSEDCLITYYDYRADDTVAYQCACDDGTCANKESSSGSGAQLAFGILFILYFFFGSIVGCGMQSKINAQQVQQQQSNLDLEMQNTANNTNGNVLNPMQPNVDLDTTRPFATNPNYNPNDGGGGYSDAMAGGGTFATPPPAPSAPPVALFAAAAPAAAPAGYPFSTYAALPPQMSTTSAPPPPAADANVSGGDYAYPPMVEAVPVAEVVHESKY